MYVGFRNIAQNWHKLGTPQIFCEKKKKNIKIDLHKVYTTLEKVVALLVYKIPTGCPNPFPHIYSQPPSKSARHFELCDVI